MQNNILVVPIKIDGLILDKPISVVESLASFDRLPYTDTVYDRNPETPYISEDIVTPPFAPKNMRLGVGAHIHWALPDALTNMNMEGENAGMPLAPNRWMVFRTSPTLGNKVQIVESDYVHPLGQGTENTPYPVAKNLFTPNNETFRHIGRKVELGSFIADENNSKSKTDYLNTNDTFDSKLGPLGYGDTNFAAFYPSCHSVFGYHDPEVTTSNVTDVTYEVYGWYSKEEDDELNKFVANYQKEKEAKGEVVTVESVVEAIQEELDWQIDFGKDLFSSSNAISSTKDVPNRTLCSGMIEFTGTTPVPRTEEVDIAIGYSGPEALGSYLAKTIANRPDIELTKEQIEDQFEAILQREKLDHLQLDVMAKMKEACHEHGFMAVDPGNIWEIAVEDNSNTSADAETGGKRENIKIPEVLAEKLDSLNVLQRKYNKGQREILDARRQLFSDWNKYMVATYPIAGVQGDYPDTDAIRNFMEAKSLAPLEARIIETGFYNVQRNAEECVTNATVVEGVEVNATASLLVTVLNDIIADIEELNQGTEANMAMADFCLKEVQEPRYWEPREPVIMLKGDAITSTDRHGRDGEDNDGLLDCTLFNMKNAESFFHNDVSELRALFVQSNQKLNANGKKVLREGTRTQATEPWNPLFLEWETNIAPVQDGNNLNSMNSRYAKDFINSNFELPKDSCDLKLKDKDGLLESTDAYVGRIALDGFATDTFVEQLKDYLRREISGDYLSQESESIPEGTTSEEYFFQNIDAAITLYEAKDAVDKRSAVDNAIIAYKELTEKGVFVLSQAISGLNDQLRQQLETLQLDIADPIGFQKDQEFAERVMNLLDDENNTAALPLASFNPIRTGHFKIQRLRLIDTFGRVQDLAIEKSKVVSTEGLKTDRGNYHAYFKPRVIQPTKMNFRWLSAKYPEMESNSHPDTTPVCGWVVPVFFDGSFNIYNTEGNILGIIPQNGVWESAPGGGIQNPSEIPNEALRNFVLHLLGQGSTFLSGLIDSVEESTRRTETEPGGQGSELALITGKPLAIVRSTVDWFVEGQAAIDQSWTSFRLDLFRGERHTAGFDEVEFPIRVGEFAQMNDGVIGYFVENGNKYENNIFYAPKNDGDHHSLIKSQSNPDDPVNINVTIKEDATKLLMLVDPMAKVHLTSGVLPAKVISILPEHYRKALESLEIIFQVAPILSGKSKFEIPVPEEEGYYWSWQQEVKGENGLPAWKSILRQGVIQKKMTLDRFKQNDDFWKALINARWIDGLDGPTSSAHVLLTGDKFPESIQEFTHNTMDVSNHIANNAPGGILERADIESFFTPRYDAFISELVANDWIDPKNSKGHFPIATTQNPAGIGAEFAFTMGHINMLRKQRIGRGYITDNELKACLAQGGMTLWKNLIQEGVLNPIHKDAQIGQAVDKDDRIAENLPTEFQSLQEEFEQLLTEDGFGKPTENANYPAYPQFNEGWLRLTKLQEQ